MTELNSGQEISTTFCVRRENGARSRKTPDRLCSLLSGPCVMSRLGRMFGPLYTSSVITNYGNLPQFARTCDICLLDKCCKTWRIRQRSPSGSSSVMIFAHLKIDAVTSKSRLVVRD